MFLIDTNVFSELRRVARTDPNVRAWADAIQLGDTFMSSITLLEVERGALRVARRDPVQGKVLLAWLETLLSEYSGRILPVDVAVARQAAQLHVPDPRPEHDALIAATAILSQPTIACMAYSCRCCHQQHQSPGPSSSHPGRRWPSPRPRGGRQHGRRVEGAGGRGPWAVDL